MFTLRPERQSVAPGQLARLLYARRLATDRGDGARMLRGAGLLMPAP